MHSKFFNKQGDIIHYHRSSSIWTGIKDVIPDINCRSQWCIGNCRRVDLWRHNWLGSISIKETLNLRVHDIANLNAKFECLIEDSDIVLLAQLADLIEAAGFNVNNVVKRDDLEEDTLIWCPIPSGTFSVKSAFQEIRSKCNEK
ncbi:Ribonuclease h domain [Thalictrum thalictroides]|uniref:Ribonuclease h domain n=1 Tax=Thalictrum thalictroides TaxID=46969 RepID=A0A7J6VMU8_THATH|nr:Ribonuclease h domain [Thalictrum thalictroides]